MKILFVSGSTFPSEVSHTLSKLKLCQAFSDQGHEIVLTGVRSKKIKISAEDFYGLSGDFKLVLQNLSFLDNKITRKLKIKNIINGFFQLYQLKKFKPDIIYSRLTLFELLFVSNNIPIIYEMHSLGFLGKNKISKILFRKLIRLKNFKKIIVSSEALLKLLKPHIENIEIVVARLSAEEPLNISKNQLKIFKQTNLKSINFKYNVGYTGFLDTVGLRGTDIICELASLMPDTAFHVVGGNPEAVTYWKEYSKKYNSNQNTFFYGYQNPKLIPYFLNCFDVVLAPLQYKPEPRAPLGAGSSPLKIPQYMAYKKAMVVSDLNSHREILSDNVTALFVRHDDVKQWFDKIRLLLDSRSIRKKMGENCYNEYLKNFTPRGRIKKILYKT